MGKFVTNISLRFLRTHYMAMKYLDTNHVEWRKKYFHRRDIFLETPQVTIQILRTSTILPSQSMGWYTISY